MIDVPPVFDYPFPGRAAVYAVEPWRVDWTCREIGGTASRQYLACTIRFSDQVCFTVLPARASRELRRYENGRCNGWRD